MPQPRDGRIITFYSFADGSGATMALANVAWILAAGGCRPSTGPALAGHAAGRSPPPTRTRRCCTRRPDSAATCAGHPLALAAAANAVAPRGGAHDIPPTVDPY